MNGAGRVLVSLVIWIGTFAMIGGTFTSAVGPVNRMNSGELLGFVAVVVLGAAIATAAMWTGGKEASLSADERRAKAKRMQSNRVQRLLSDLNDDEVYELEALLLTRDEPQGSSTVRR